MYFIAIFIFIGLILFNAAMNGGSVAAVIDVLSLLLVILLTVPMLTGAGLLKDFFKAFSLSNKKNIEKDKRQIRRSMEAVSLTGRLVLCAGVITTVLGLISMLISLSSPELVGPYVSVALISLLYAFMLEMILLPVKSKLKLMLEDSE